MVTSWLRRRGYKSAGAWIAGTIAFGWLVAGLIISVINPNLLLGVLALLVPPIAIVVLLGHRLAKEAISSEHGIWATIGLGVLTVVVNSYVVSFEVLVKWALTPPYPGQPQYDAIQIVIALLLNGLIGLLFVGWIAILPALVSASVWALAIRHCYPRGSK